MDKLLLNVVKEPEPCTSDVKLFQSAIVCGKNENW
jgi:hypothetical protein